MPHRTYRDGPSVSEKAGQHRKALLDKPIRAPHNRPNGGLIKIEVPGKRAAGVVTAPRRTGGAGGSDIPATEEGSRVPAGTSRRLTCEVEVTRSVGLEPRRPGPSPPSRLSASALIGPAPSGLLRFRHPRRQGRSCSMNALTRCGERQHRPDVFRFQVREIRQDLLFRHPGGQVLQHIVHCDPETPNARLTGPRARFQRDAFQRVRTLRIPGARAGGQASSEGCRAKKGGRVSRPAQRTAEAALPTAPRFSRSVLLKSNRPSTRCRPFAKAARRGPADVPPGAEAVEIVLRVHDTFRDGRTARDLPFGRKG